MGLSNEIPWYQLLAIAVILSIYEQYLIARKRTFQYYDWVEDAYRHVHRTVARASEGVLYRLGLSHTAHVPRVFPQFQRLPAEIRCQIWQHALPGPRVIEMRNVRDAATSEVRGDLPGARSTARIPAMLHVCHEARHEALKVYELSFGMSFGEVEFPSQIYVDFSRDTVYFGAKADFYGVHEVQHWRAPPGRVRGLEQIRHLAIRSNYFRDVTRFDLNIFRTLEQVILVRQEGGRRFELGDTPTLVKKTQIGYDDLLTEMNSLRHMIQLQDRMEIWKETHADFQVPMVRRGHFIKGEGDRWYCGSRSTWSF